MITIVDYGLGNIKAFVNVYNRLNIAIKIAHSVADLRASTKIILPGVGDFDHAMTLINNSGFRETLDDLVLNKKIPVLGICVGMQILAKSSEEGNLPGLGWINASVKKFDQETIPFKTHLPHMGWNTLDHIVGNKLLNDLEVSPRFYFLHSYYFDCNNTNNIIASTNYGIDFASAVNNVNIYGVQFHPEKSHHNGVQILKNFGNL